LLSQTISLKESFSNTKKVVHTNYLVNVLKTIGISCFEEIVDSLHPRESILFGSQEEETILFEELRGNQELAHFYNLVQPFIING